MTLKEKVLSHFDGRVVRKDLTSRVKGNAVVPTYVLEYLLGQHCAVDDEEVIRKGVETVKTIITNNYVHRSEAELIKATIRDQGSYKIIDKINVSLNDRDNLYEAQFSNLGLNHVPISDAMVRENEKLLSGGGVWCILDMAYSHAPNTQMRWVITNIKPIQIARINLDEYIKARADFETEEWLDLLMHSIGLNPEYFNRRGKLIQLSRLITHVENNYNFIELGPKGTGKSHIFSELSPHGVLVSGGDVSKARLFVNNNGDKIGLVGYWDVVALDEFEQEKGGKRTDGDLVKIMQNYMANQSFNRGKDTYQATASLAFVGNTKHTIPYILKNSHLFESIPDGYIKGAFLDRIHMFVPGWEVKILKNEVFSSDFGFIVDYLAEILKELRKYDYSGILEDYIELDGSLTQRDKTAIRKSFSGMVKIIYPHKVMTEDEVLELTNFAIEGRKRVKDQLYIIDETFKSEPADFSYLVKRSGRTYNPETLEMLNFRTAQENYQQSPGAQDQSNGNELQNLKAIVKDLHPHQVTLYDNQTGISYQKLFSDYLRGASVIVLQDPYIRFPYQYKNLLEFCIMLSQLKNPDEEIYLELITWNTPEHMQTSLDNLREFQDSIQELGIQFQFIMEDVHDRYIKANNGWKISLGRGLDIFDRSEGRFNVADLDQTRRSCKACDITYLRHGE